MDYFKLIQSIPLMSEEFGVCWESKSNASFNHLKVCITILAASLMIGGTT